MGEPAHDRYGEHDLDAGDASSLALGQSPVAAQKASEVTGVWLRQL